MFTLGLSLEAQFSGPRRRWEDNIRKDLKKIGINTRNWIDLVMVKHYWRALVNVALNLRVL